MGRRCTFGMAMIGLGLFAGPPAWAGDGWLRIEQSDRVLALPMAWLDEGGSLETIEGRVALHAMHAALNREPEGWSRTVTLVDGGTATFVHRPASSLEERSLEVTTGGFSMALDLTGTTVEGVFASLDVSVGGTALPVRIDPDDEDVLGPLRRAGPVVVFEGRSRKGKPIRVRIR